MNAPQVAPCIPVQLARRWVVDYFNAHDDAAAREFIAPEYALEIGDHLLAGRDTQWLPAVARQFAQFPGMGMTVHQVVAGSEDKANRVAVWFSEHGAAGGPGGPVAVWSGVGIYQSNGDQLVACCAQEDYFTRARQLRQKVTDRADPPAPAPWDVLPMGSNLPAESVVQNWLANSWPQAQPEVHVDDEHITGQRMVFDVQSVDILDIFSSAEQVAFHACQHGTYRSGLSAGVERNRLEKLQVNGILQVQNGFVTGGRVIRDRGGLKARLMKD
jgi:SnoaL-like domain